MSCSSKKKINCVGPDCKWVVGTGCRKSNWEGPRRRQREEPGVRPVVYEEKQELEEKESPRRVSLPRVSQRVSPPRRQESCSKKRHSDCVGPNCKWVIGTGCRKSNWEGPRQRRHQSPVRQSPVRQSQMERKSPRPRRVSQRVSPSRSKGSCYKKRKSVCMNSTDCEWVVGTGCRPKVLVERQRQIMEQVLPPRQIVVYEEKEYSPPIPPTLSVDFNKITPTNIEKYYKKLINYLNCSNPQDYFTMDNFDSNSDIIYIIVNDKIQCFDRETLRDYVQGNLFFLGELHYFKIPPFMNIINNYKISLVTHLSKTNLSFLDRFIVISSPIEITYGVNSLIVYHYMHVVKALQFVEQLQILKNLTK